MTVHLCRCWICGTYFKSGSANSDDCGANDERHIKARNG